MLAAVLAALPGTDVLLMAAAVADFKPRHISGQKIKRQAGTPTIELELAVDILAAVAGLQIAATASPPDGGFCSREPGAGGERQG